MANHLRLVQGDQTHPVPVDEIVVARAAARAERNEPWTLAVTPALRDLDEDAADLGLDFELALRLGVETALVSEELRALDVLLAPLDNVAAHASVGQTVDAFHAAYLRRLTAIPARIPRELDGHVVVGLPARLSTRLLATDIPALLGHARLQRARAWEIAAVLSGRTISEWAPMTALALAH